MLAGAGETLVDDGAAQALEEGADTREGGGVATDHAGNIYVIDRQFENVQVFDPQGRILMAFGEEGNGPGQFWLPAGIFIGEDDRIYVADAYNGRIDAANNKDKKAWRP